MPTAHQLPRLPLCPVTLNIEAKHASFREARLLAAIRAAPLSARATRERIWRVINQRRRLVACHWAGWRPERTSQRWGTEGLKWLVRRGAL